MQVLGYALLALAALAAHFCALKPEVIERWLLRLFGAPEPAVPEEVYIPNFSVVEGART
jgi:hypothetical protein